MVGKALMVFALALALMAAPASAGMTPQPVSVFVKNEGVLSGYEVQLTNLDTGDTVTVVTDSAGFQIYDWTGTAHGSQAGNRIKAVVLACSGQAQCTVIKVIEPTAVNPNVGKPLVLNIDITGAACAVCAKCESCTQHGGDCECNCPSCGTCPADVTPYDSCSSCCAAAPEDTTPYDKCDSCCAEKECPAPADNTWAGFGLGALLALVVSAVGFMGGGMKIYRKKVGGVALQHNHAGATTYHDVNTKHSNPKYAHRLFKNDPIGFAEDVKKINDAGGLV